MARIRSLKPEFPQSETMGRVSRDARLLFIQLWTLADDSGRLRGNSRMLASLLYPYDDDAKELLPAWLSELCDSGAVRKYEVDGETYLDIPKWLSHQKIDKPSASKLPQFDEDSRGFARLREKSLGREGKGEEGNIGASPEGDALPPTKSDPIPYERIADLFNATMTRLAKVREVTAKRRTLIRNAWQSSTQRRSVEFWQEYFEECESDSFLNGTGPYRNGHENWRPDFEYLLRSDVVTKTYEKALDRMERRQ